MMTRLAVEASFAEDAVKEALSAGSISPGIAAASRLPPPQDPLLLEETQCQSAASPPSYSRPSCWCWAWSPQDAAATTIRARVGWSGDSRDRDAGEEGDQGRPRHRHRRSQRPLVQPARQRGPRAGEVRARRRGPGADVQVERGLRAEPLDAGAAEVRPRDRRRLPDGGRDEHRRDEVPRHEVRDHRLPAVGPEGQADQRPRPAVQGERGRLPRRLPGRPRTSRTRAATR